MGAFGAGDRDALPGPVARKAREELRTPRAAGVAGLVFAALFTGALLLDRGPTGATSASFATWYTGAMQSTILLSGLYVVPFAGIAFLWFIGVVRDRIGRREDRFFSTVFLGSGLLFVAMLFAAAASWSALALRADAFGGVQTPVNSGALQLAQALGYAFLYVYAARAAGVFMIATSTIAWSTRAVPRWVAVVGYAIAAMLLLSVRYFHLVLMLFPAWVALLSLFILLTTGSVDIDDDVTAGTIE